MHLQQHGGETDTEIRVSTEKPILEKKILCQRSSSQPFSQKPSALPLSYIPFQHSQYHKTIYRGTPLFLSGKEQTISGQFNKQKYCKTPSLLHYLEGVGFHYVPYVHQKHSTMQRSI